MSEALPIIRLAPGRTVVVATHNDGKLIEFRDLLAPYGLNLRSAGELGLAEPEETGATFEENAALKAAAATRKAKLPAIGDDSGLAVDALGGEPGIYSARWAGSGRDRNFARAMEKVEERLQASGALRAEQRRATFVAVIAFADGDRPAETFRGEVHGHLVWPPRGDKGFGYDPMFVPDGETRTFGEMAPAEKEALSHRTRAFAAFAARLL